MRKILITAAAVIILSTTLHAALLFDNAELAANNLGGSWVSYNDGYSSITMTVNSAPGYAGNYCRRLDWTILAGNTGPFVGAASGLNSGWNDYDLSPYYGVRFYAKGGGGHEIILAEEETRTQNNHYSKPLSLTTSWQYFEVPFTQFTQTWGTHATWDPAKVYSVEFLGIGAPGATGWIAFDNIEFYTAAEATPATDPNVIILKPKANQLGYLPGAKKYFTVVTNTASAGDTFWIFDAGGNTAMMGTVTGSPFDDRQSTGEGVYKVDFSSVTAPGTYHVAVNGQESYTFNIANNVYDQVFKDSLRCFYLIRCGLAINDPITGLNRNACHLAPDTIRGGAGTRDMSGGWHNAGDLGKWAHEEAISCSYMMWLYELRQTNMSGLNNNIKESGNGMSDLLNEAKWGLDWMLKLQLPDGSVYHKSDTEPNFCWGTKPDLDPFTRYVSFQQMSQPQNPSSIDAGVFTAVMAQASRVYAGILPAYSNTCGQAAQLSWNWLKNNRGIGQTDPYYTDAVSWQEEEWAMAEIFRLTGDAAVSALFDADTNSHALEGTSWQTPEFFGYFSLWKDAKTPAALKNKMQSRIISLCDSITATANNAGYGVARAWTDYYWESNEDLMHKSDNLLMGYEVTGNTVYKDTALNQLGYMLGNNSLNKSFVTKEGTDYASHPYNWTYYDYNILIPGWASGGPNEWASGAGSDASLIDLINLGTPPAKCWLDLAASNGSYASNEGETSENAALVFLSGYFYSVVYPSPTPTPAPAGTPAPNLDNIKAVPAPCDIRAGCNGIMFVNLTGHTILHIYNMKGERIYSVETDTPEGKLLWKLTDKKKDETIASGLYVYSVNDGKRHVKTGKTAVLR
jgi:endoglucanase